MALTAPIIAALVAVHIDARVRQVARRVAPKLNLARGTNAVVALTVRNSDNSRANILGAAIVLTVYRKSNGEALISRIGTITSAANGEALFRFVRSDTSSLGLGDSYQYTVEANWSGGDWEQLIPLTSCAIVKAAEAGSPVTTPEVEEIIGYGIPITKSGTAAFANAARASVAFDSPMPDANYSVTLGSGLDTEDGGILVPAVDPESVTVNGFDIVLGGAGTGSIGWSVHE